MRQWKWNTFRPIPILIYLLLFLLDILLYSVYQRSSFAWAAAFMVFFPLVLFIYFSLMMVYRRWQDRRREKQAMLRPVRIVSYGILFFLDVMFFAVLHSYFLLVIAVIMAVCPFFSIYGLKRLCQGLQLRVVVGQETAVCGEALCLELHIDNPMWYAALDSRILLKIANVFYGTDSQVTASMPVQMHGISVLQLPIQVQELGRFRIECRQFVVQDILGMVCCAVAVSGSCEVCVYPREKKSDGLEITGFLAGATESEESHSKGSDFAEVSEIREYVPGDRIRDIHWKLSAKQDILMVKERMAMAGTEMVILLQFSPSRSQARELLETVYGLGKAFILLQFPIRLLCWSRGQYAFEEYCCGTASELLEAFGNIYRTSLQQRICQEQEVFMKNCYPYLERYLVAVHRDGEVQVVMCENV